ncbi:MAG TPA: hypothetical protein VGH10_10230 [Actinomycetota bacterium]
MSETQFEARRYRTAAIIVGIIGILALLAGIAYLVVPISSLPHIHLVGWLPNATGHHSKRGIAGLILGVILLGVAAWCWVRAGRLEY